MKLHAQIEFDQSERSALAKVAHVISLAFPADEITAARIKYFEARNTTESRHASRKYEEAKRKYEGRHLARVCDHQSHRFSGREIQEAWAAAITLEAVLLEQSTEEYWQPRGNVSMLHEVGVLARRRQELLDVQAIIPILNAARNLLPGE